MTYRVRKSVITFSGTAGEFMEFLNSWGVNMDGTAVWDDLELTATIGRHPAGKGLRAGDPPPHRCMVTPGTDECMTCGETVRPSLTPDPGWCGHRPEHNPNLVCIAPPTHGATVHRYADLG